MNILVVEQLFQAERSIACRPLQQTSQKKDETDWSRTLLPRRSHSNGPCVDNLLPPCHQGVHARWHMTHEKCGVTHLHTQLTTATPRCPRSAAPPAERHRNHGCREGIPRNRECLRPAALPAAAPASAGWVAWRCRTLRCAGSSCPAVSASRSRLHCQQEALSARKGSRVW